MTYRDTPPTLLPCAYCGDSVPEDEHGVHERLCELLEYLAGCFTYEPPPRRKRQKPTVH